MMGFKWIKKYCKQADFILRFNDDLVINTYALLPYLESLRNKKVNNMTLIGSVYERIGVIRNKSNKFYVSYEQYSDLLYVDFVEGSAYIYDN